VGSDILAGIAATKMTEHENYSVLIDLGTNGEIVVGNRNKLFALQPQQVRLSKGQKSARECGQQPALFRRWILKMMN
jgi:hypothetical protein